MGSERYHWSRINTLSHSHSLSFSLSLSISLALSLPLSVSLSLCVSIYLSVYLSLSPPLSLSLLISLLFSAYSEFMPLITLECWDLDLVLGIETWERMVLVLQKLPTPTPTPIPLPITTPLLTIRATPLLPPSLSLTAGRGSVQARRGHGLDRPNVPANWAWLDRLLHWKPGRWAGGWCMNVCICISMKVYMYVWMKFVCI